MFVQGLLISLSHLDLIATERDRAPLKKLEAATGDDKALVGNSVWTLAQAPGRKALHLYPHPARARGHDWPIIEDPSGDRGLVY